MLANLIKTLASTDNLLTDGIIEQPYTTLSFQVTKIWEDLLAQGLTKADTVIFGCENTITDALVLITLLWYEQSLLLRPKTNIEQDQHPSFCRYYLQVDNGKIFLSTNPYFTQNPSVSNAKQFLLRTSGSTGTPKLVSYTQKAIIENAQHVAKRFQLSYQDRIAIPVPLFHMYGLGAGFLPSLLSGAAINIQANSNALKYLKNERNFNPNIAFMTPVFAENLLKIRSSKRLYKFTVLAGDRMRQQSFESYEKMFGPVVALYGSTEMGALAAANTALDFDTRKNSAGLPMPDVKIQLDENGQLLCKRDCGFQGYVDFTGALTLYKKQCWFASKDHAKVHSQGYLTLLGRMDHSVNRDGLLVSFSEVEAAIEKLSEIEKVIVVSIGESTRGKKLIALCQIIKNSPLTPQTIRQHCLQSLTLRAVPDEVHLWSEFPLLPNGKINRIALEEMIKNKGVL